MTTVSDRAEPDDEEYARCMIVNDRRSLLHLMIRMSGSQPAEAERVLACIEYYVTRSRIQGYSRVPISRDVRGTGLHQQLARLFPHGTPADPGSLGWVIQRFVLQRPERTILHGEDSPNNCWMVVLVSDD